MNFISKQHSILIVDDEPIVTSNLSTLLEAGKLS